MNEFGLTDAAGLCRPRDTDSHKGSYGHGLLIAGSYGMAGAAVMAAGACLRSGIGLLTVSTPECNRTILQTSVPEAMIRSNGEECWELQPGKWKNPIDDVSQLHGKYSAIAAGPGLGTSMKTSGAFLEFMTALRSSASPVGPNNSMHIILDADALNVISSSGRTNLLAGTLITPHLGEFHRLIQATDGKLSETQGKTLRTSGDKLSSDLMSRSETAARFAAMHHCHVILKGHRTIVASPDGQISTNTTGNPGMATGGSGDVLTGILLALVSQGLNTWDAARLGVFIHGLAGDMAADILGQTSITATDIIRHLPQAWHSVLRH